MTWTPPTPWVPFQGRTRPPIRRWGCRRSHRPGRSCRIQIRRRSRSPRLQIHPRPGRKPWPKGRLRRSVSLGFGLISVSGRPGTPQHNAPVPPRNLRQSAPTTLGPMKYFPRPTTVSVGPTTPIWTWMGRACLRQLPRESQESRHWPVPFRAPRPTGRSSQCPRAHPGQKCDARAWR